MPPTTEDFRQALTNLFSSATQEGFNHVEVHAGNLHRTVGHYPGPEHRLASCCHVMKREMLTGDEIVQSPPSGKGANLIIRYQLPRPKGNEMVQSQHSTGWTNLGIHGTLPRTRPGQVEVDTYQMNISENVNKYLEDRSSEKRYTSFDYCFNYFQQFYEQDNINGLSAEQNIQNSCMYLGFYLASWGMFRGSTFLFQKSAKYFEKLILEFSKFDRKYWGIDADNYTEENIKLVLDIKKIIIHNLSHNDKKASDTLVTKIILGVFGCTPALDDNFCKAFKTQKILNKNVMKIISSYYKKNRDELDRFKINTLDFNTRQETSRLYTKAKLIDMVGFIEGIKITSRTDSSS